MDISLARTKEDKCSACVAMDIEFPDGNLSKERRAEIRELKATHINEAIIKRVAMSAFAREFVRKYEMD